MGHDWKFYTMSVELIILNPKGLPSIISLSVVGIYKVLSHFYGLSLGYKTRKVE